MSRPEGIRTGYQVAEKDYHEGQIRYFVKSEPHRSLVAAAAKIETEYGVQMEFAIIGSGSLEDDEKYIDGYNAFMLSKISDELSSELARHLVENTWIILANDDQELPEAATFDGN